MKVEYHSTHLVIALPMEFEGFASHVRISDWLAKFNVQGTEPERAKAVRNAWEREYRPLVAAPLQQLAVKASELGVQVWPEASLADFAMATRDAGSSAGCSGGLVVLFSHWKGWEVLYDDVAGLNSREAAIYLDGARGELARWLQQQLPTAGDLVGTMNDALDIELEDCSDDIVDAVLESALTRRTRRREELDRLFAGSLRPGNRVEFMDGLHERSAFEKALAPGFDCLLDLTTCTSSVLAEHLHKMRSHAFRTVQFEQTQEFLYHALCVEVALTLHLRFSMPYLEARSAANAVIAEGVRSTTH